MGTCTTLSRDTMATPPANAVNTAAVGEEFFYGVGDDMITIAGPNDYTNSGLGDDTIISAGGNDLIISRDGGDFITLGGDGDMSINTVRVYPTHEKDHLFGWKDQDNTKQCTKI